MKQNHECYQLVMRRLIYWLYMFRSPHVGHLRLNKEEYTPPRHFFWYVTRLYVKNKFCFYFGLANLKSWFLSLSTFFFKLKKMFTNSLIRILECARKQAYLYVDIVHLDQLWSLNYAKLSRQTERGEEECWNIKGRGKKRGRNL